MPVKQTIPEQGAAAINPFFFYFTRPYFLAVLVGLSMAGGVAGLTIYNKKCTTVVTAEQSYERVVGNLFIQKLWLEEKGSRPQDLPDTVTRDVRICLMAANAPTYETTTTTAGNSFIESNERCAPLCLPDFP